MIQLLNTLIDFTVIHEIIIQQSKLYFAEWDNYSTRNAVTFLNETITKQGRLYFAEWYNYSKGYAVLFWMRLLLNKIHCTLLNETITQKGMLYFAEWDNYSTRYAVLCWMTQVCRKYCGQISIKPEAGPRGLLGIRERIHSTVLYVQSAMSTYLCTC